MPELREIFLFRLESDPPAYLWSGVGLLDVEGDAIAPATRYRGLGELMEVPTVQQLINGIADRQPFGLSGVDPEILQIANGEDVRGAIVRIGSLALGPDNQPIAPVEWEWEGVADVINADSRGGVRSVSLSVGSADTARSRAALDFWTDAQQRQRSPDDAICSHVALITGGKTRRFAI